MPVNLLALHVSAFLALQGLVGLKPTIQHVTVSASSAPETAAAGGKVTLLLDVFPERNIHVYAPGAKDFVATSLKLAPPSGVAVGKTTYSPSEIVLDPILNEKIPEYVKQFRVSQPVTLPAKAGSGEAVTIAGVLTYQACDDKMCFAPSQISATWTIKIR